MVNSYSSAPATEESVILNFPLSIVIMALSLNEGHFIFTEAFLYPTFSYYRGSRLILSATY